MIRRLRLHPAAGEEFVDAAPWYLSIGNALGRDFQQELEAAMGLLMQSPIPAVPHPRLPAALGLRRVILRRFPYDLVFIERQNEIHIIALAHHARRPGYWRSRLGGR